MRTPLWVIAVAIRALLVSALLVSALQGCAADVTAVTNGTGSTTGTSTAGAGAGGYGGSAAAGGDGGSGEGAASSSSGSGACMAVTECQGQVLDCGDGVDNDGDGLTDSADPGCVGACDNTEDSYFNGVPAVDGAACSVDCYFDLDAGSGNDGCFWSHTCDPHEVAPEYYPEPENGLQCAYDPAASIPGTPLGCDDLYAGQSAECLAFCRPLTPNGCDCFGCCELPAGSGSYVWLESEDENGIGTCDVAGVADPSKCHPCEPVPGCFNPCGECELCIGKGALAPGCSVDAQCTGGEQPCGLPGEDCCAEGTYCVSGCCQPAAL
jgi:hypothetical protein